MVDEKDIPLSIIILVLTAVYYFLSFMAIADFSI